MLGRGLLGLPRYPLRALRVAARRAAQPRGHGRSARCPGAGTRGPRGRPRRARAARRGISSAQASARRALVQRPDLPAPALAFGQLSLDEVKAVKNEHGCTVNDVVVSICAGAVRRWLIEHDELPAVPLVAQIPVSVRTDEQIGTYGNRILLMRAPLFTERAPTRSAPAAHPRRAERAEGAPPARCPPSCSRTPTTSSRPPSSRAPRALTFRLPTSRAGRPTWNLVISNVPGPAVPALLRGRAARGQLPRVRDHRRHGAEHHRHELLRPSTSASWPTATRCRPLAPDGLARRRAEELVAAV